jgi:hypothetical protein
MGRRIFWAINRERMNEIDGQINGRVSVLEHNRGVRCLDAKEPFLLALGFNIIHLIVI